MLSVFAGSLVITAACPALGSLALSWLRYRPAWAALREEMAKGPPTNTVTVTIRNTTVQGRDVPDRAVPNRSVNANRRAPERAYPETRLPEVAIYRPEFPAKPAPFAGALRVFRAAA